MTQQQQQQQKNIITPFKKKVNDPRETTGKVPRPGKFGRSFSSFSSMSAWINDPETLKNNKIGWIDWANNVLEVEERSKRHE